MRDKLKWILPLAVLFLAVVIVAGMVKMRSKTEPVPREIPVPVVRTVTAHAEPHQLKVFSQGTVAPRTDIQLVAEVSGRVESVSPSFAAGGFFKAGEVLLSMEDTDYELAVIRAEAVLAEAQVRLAREEAESEVARQEWSALGSGPPGALVLREPQLAEARAAVKAATANLEQAKLDLARCSVSAPFDGRVWEKRADLGQFIARGTAVARVYAVDYAEVPLPLPLDEIGFLNLPASYRDGADDENQPEVILSASIGGETHEWRGRVVRTAGEIDPQTRMLTVIARVDDPFGRSPGEGRPPLSVGLFVDATIVGKRAGSVFLIPRAAIQGRDRVMVVSEDDRLRFRKVEVVRFEGDRAVVRSGLKEGERVCVSPLDAPVDGMRVRVAGSERELGATNQSEVP